MGRGEADEHETVAHSYYILAESNYLITLMSRTLFLVSESSPLMWRVDSTCPSPVDVIVVILISRGQNR